MAEDFAELVMEGVPLVAEHYDKVYDPLKDKTKKGVNKVKNKMGGGHNRGGGGGGGAYYSEDEYESDDHYAPPPQRRDTQRRRSPPGGYDDRPRSGRGEVVEERYAYSKGNGRAKSVGRDGNGGGRSDIRSTKGKSKINLFHTSNAYRAAGSRRDYSDSESSLSPPRRERRKSLGEKALVALGLGGAAAGAEKSHDRRRDRRRDRSSSGSSSGYWRRKDNRSRGNPRSNGGYDDDRTPDRYKPAGYAQNGDRDGGGSQVARRNNKSEVGQRNGGGGEKENKSSSESSDVCSSSEDERRTKKMKGKEYVTAGLAAVATIHAAHSVYASMEKRDARHKQVEEGEMSPEEARKKKNKARLQDAAAIGIAALGIKGAYSEWKEVQEHRHELAEQEEERSKRHEKRLKRAEKAGRGARGSGGRNRSEPPRRRDRS
ncbi:hypothetical protein MMC28_004388 [Mycoblastus sanguinarius]|nr:hypothetical protein [Mycoblastus sanguinarius]